MHISTASDWVRLVSAAWFWSLLVLSQAHAVESAPIEIESKVALGEVRGRIDHLAVDVRRQRLFVAELGNDSVGVIDLQRRTKLRTLTGLREPQGIGYVATTDTLYVANGGDGSVRLFQGADLTPVGQIPLGEDADNVRVDESAHRVWVGYGSGALAIIDADARAKIGEVSLKGHPESFQLQRAGSRIFVNVPEARQIAVVDRTQAQQLASWPTLELQANFPLALEEPDRVLVVFRRPARLAVFRQQQGDRVAVMETCGDSDDLFVDPKRHRVYVICGEGFVDVFSREAASYQRIAHLPTAPGARTGLFVPDLDRLFVAVRASPAGPAAVWSLRPLP